MISAVVASLALFPVHPPADLAASLQGHVRFLASDTLAGRSTPSPGLEAAAEYIAARFQEHGLSGLGSNGYFQVAPYKYRAHKASQVSIVIQTEDNAVSLNLGEIAIGNADIYGPVKLPVLVRTAESVMTGNEVLDGQAVVVRISPGQDTPRGRREVINAARSSGAKAIFMLRGGEAPPATGRLLEPGGRVPQLRSPDLLEVSVWSEKLDSALSPGDRADAHISIEAPAEQPIELRNVIGLIRGTDLSDEIIVVTAHYDHVGVRPGAADTIYNGANDDASGVSAIIEAAGLLTSGGPLRRSVLFVAVFGEERGLLGSRYYVEHPLFPLTKTVANINAEQVGRTDSDEGDRTGWASLTGFGYSTVSTVFANVADSLGYRVEKHPTRSDAFFARSDNVAFAQVGIPAHTLTTAFVFPDYHQPGDHWDKLNYENMAVVTRVLAESVRRIANADSAPTWSETEPRAKRYYDAWKALHGRSGLAGQIELVVQD